MTYQPLEPLGTGAQLATVDTSIVRDMRAAARELGIVDLLLAHQRVIYQRPAEAYDLVEDALIRLGVHAGELLENLQGKDSDR